jgi:hypothetical protein
MLGLWSSAIPDYSKRMAQGMTQEAFGYGDLNASEGRFWLFIVAGFWVHRSLLSSDIRQRSRQEGKNTFRLPKTFYLSFGLGALGIVTFSL